MTPAELGQQQVWAAWVSAAAAVAQAIGTVAAIVWSVRIAEQAARRERKAEAASVAREKAAEAASEARAERAEHAAAEREALVERDRFNRPIDIVAKVGAVVLSDFDAFIVASRAAVSSEPLSWRMGGFTAPSLEDLGRAVDRALATVTDPDLLLALEDLARDAKATSVTSSSVQGEAYLRNLESRRAILAGSLADVERLRRT